MRVAVDFFSGRKKHRAGGIQMCKAYELFVRVLMQSFL